MLNFMEVDRASSDLMKDVDFVNGILFCCGSDGHILLCNVCVVLLYFAG